MPNRGGFLAQEAANRARKEQRIFDLYADGKIGDEKYRTETERVRNTLSDIADRLEEKLIDEMELTDLLEFASWFIEHLDSIWYGASAVNKRKIQGVVFPGGIEVDLGGLVERRRP